MTPISITPRGGAVTARGGWNYNTPYYQDDLVEWQGEEYRSILPYNLGYQPDVSGWAWILTAPASVALRSLKSDYGALGNGTDESIIIENAVNDASKDGAALVIDGQFVAAGINLLGTGHHIIGAPGSSITTPPGSTLALFILGDGNHPFTIGSGANHTWYQLSGTFPVGNDRITVATPANVNNFPVGTLIWIRCRQNVVGLTNQPTAELNIVQWINSTTGDIGLEHPLAKAYSDGGDGTIFGVATAGTEVVQDIRIEGLHLVAYGNRPFDGGCVYGGKIHHCWLQGRGGIGWRGRFLDAHDNRIEVHPDWHVPVARPYYVEVDTGNCDFEFHDNLCTSRGIGIVHLHEGQANCDIHNNTFESGIYDRTTSYGTGDTDGTNILKNVQNPGSYTVGNAIEGTNIPPATKINSVNTGANQITLSNTTTGTATGITLYTYVIWSIVSLRGGSWNVSIENNKFINAPGQDCIGVSASSNYVDFGNQSATIRNNSFSGRMVDHGISVAPRQDNGDQGVTIEGNTFSDPAVIINATLSGDIISSDLTTITRRNRPKGQNLVYNNGNPITTENPIYMYSDRFLGLAGVWTAATLGTSTSGRRGGWQFRHGAGMNDQCFGAVLLPFHWLSINIDILWALLTGTGACRFQFVYAWYDDTMNIDTLDSGVGNPAAVTANAAGVLTATRELTNGATQPGKFMSVKVQRNGADATDTATGLAQLWAVKFTPTKIATTGS